MIIGTDLGGLTVSYATRPSRCASWYPAGFDLTPDEARRLAEGLWEDDYDVQTTDETGELVDA